MYTEELYTYTELKFTLLDVYTGAKITNGDSIQEDIGDNDMARINI